MIKSPFKFLDSYTKDDREIFFGREREIEELYHRVFESKIMLVYGVSGTGKSSLIHCGLANKFQETDWLPLVIRRGGNIIESMSAAIKAASITAQQAHLVTPPDFKKSVRSLYLDYYKPVFFVFDQFEELFIFGDREERRAFIHIVKTLTESDLQCRMIFVMREEYMAWVTEFEKFISTFFSNRVRIEKMSHRNALEAIKGPCKVFNISLEEGFAESLLEKLSPSSEDVELTYMQVFLDKIFRLATGFLPPPGSLSRESGKELKGGSALNFTIALLQKTGNVSDLLGSFLDEQISLMKDPETSMSVLKAFVSGKGTKRPASEQEAIDNIKSFGKEISSDTIKELILAFVKLRVLRDKDDNDRYELRHDTLAEKVFEKFSTAEKELLEIRQFIENSYQASLKRKILLSNEDLEYISGKDSLLNLSPEFQAFMDESRQRQKAMKRTVKRLVIFSAAALLILLSTIFYTLINRTKKSTSIQLAKESVIQFTRPVDRLCLASEAWQAFKTEEAKEALLKAFNFAIRNPGDNEELISLKKNYLLNFTPVSSPIIFASCSRDNRFIYGYTSDSIFIWETNGKLYKGFSFGSSLPVNIQMTGDGRYIGVVNTDSTLTVLDNLGHECFSHKIGYNSVNREQIFRFDTENRIIVISSDKEAELLDIDGKLLQSFDNHKGKVNAVDISDDRRFIATAGSDSTVNIWYYNSDNKKFDFYKGIHFYTDTILSIDFAPNSRYILSASNNSTVSIADINGKLTFEIRGDIKGDYRNVLSVGDPFFAEFNDKGDGMIIKSKEQKNNRQKFFMSALYVDIYYHIAQTGQINKFDYLRFSPDDKYISVSRDSDNSLLSENVYLKSDYALINNYKLLEFSGEMPFFSQDCNYIYSICGDHLESWYIDIESISEIALGFHNKWIDYLR